MSTDQPTLRLVPNCGLGFSDASKSSIERPVTSESDRKFFVEGNDSSFTHSQTVGCLTPTASANANCVVPVDSSHCLSRNMERSIGTSYANAIGRSYVSLPYDLVMGEQTFWDRVLEALKDRGIVAAQQTHVASLVKIKQPSVAEWANGDTLPSMKNARVLAEKLGVNVEWLLTGRGEKRPGRPSDAYAEQLWASWPKLTEDVKQKIIGFAAVSETVKAEPIAIPERRKKAR